MDVTDEFIDDLATAIEEELDALLARVGGDQKLMNVWAGDYSRKFLRGYFASH